MQARSRKRILIVCHEASYTGAPILLLALIRFLIQEKNANLEIVIVRGGKLESEFKKWGTVTILKPEGYSNAKGFRKLIMMIRNRIKIISVFFKALRSDFIFSNSIVNGFILEWIRFSGRPIYTYVHELKSVIDLYLQQGNAKGSFKHSRLFFYPCEAVKKNLIDHYHVDPEKLHRLNYYFSSVELTDYTNREMELSISFCGVGTVSDRKGTDLFIEVAKRVHLSNPAITFVWYGSFENEESEKHYRSMAIHADGGKIIDFGGSLSPVMLREKYTSFDGLMLTSREDPYPLVVLEAAFNNKPSLVFEWGGGISEFVADCGWVVQDVETMANTILRLTKEELRNKGILARNKAMDWHANKKRLSEQLNVLFS